MAREKNTDKLKKTDKNGILIISNSLIITIETNIAITVNIIFGSQKLFTRATSVIVIAYLH